MKIRMRRLRENPALRELVCETRLHPSDFIYPVFVVEGQGQKQEIVSMPGVFRYSVDMLEEEIKDVMSRGIGSVILFGIPGHKDACGSDAFDDNGIVQRAIRQIRAIAPKLYIIADVCMCEYTDHGHCGILDPDGSVNNDKTLDYLCRISLSCVKAGADMIAPSDMMDGRVEAIRQALDENGYERTPIMAYSAKYASNFYGPFRHAAESAPAFGDRRSYQMDYRNAAEAIREVSLDISEGADIVMVKPAVMCLDVIRSVRDRFDMPLAAYMVSGEYSMIKNAIMAGLLNADAMYEAHIAIKRAGAGMIISYAAKELCERID